MLCAFVGELQRLTVQTLKAPIRNMTKSEPIAMPTMPLTGNGRFEVMVFTVVIKRVVLMTTAVVAVVVDDGRVVESVRITGTY